MNHKGITFEPKLEELLREVAAEPDSCLLRVDKKASHKALLRTPEVVSHAATQLSPAERDIARFYREEVAWLLLELCLYLSVNDPNRGIAINTRVLASDQSSPPTAQYLEKRRKQLHRATSEMSEPLALVSQCLSAEPGPSLGDVAEAASRLVPSMAARGYARIHLINRGEFAEALRLSDLIARNPGTTRSRVSNCEGRGRIAFVTRNHPEALAAYRESYHSDPTRALPAALWLLNSLATGDKLQAEQAVDAFDDVVGKDKWSSDEVLACLNHHRTSTEPTPLDRDLALRVAEAAGPAGQQLIDEIR